MQETLPSSHRVQSGTSCFLNFLNHRRKQPDVADPLLVPDLVNGLCEEVFPFAGCQKGGQEK